MRDDHFVDNQKRQTIENLHGAVINDNQLNRSWVVLNENNENSFMGFQICFFKVFFLKKMSEYIDGKFVTEKCWNLLFIKNNQN